MCARHNHSTASSRLCTAAAASSFSSSRKCSEHSEHWKKCLIKPLQRKHCQPNHPARHGRSTCSRRKACRAVENTQHATQVPLGAPQGSHEKRAARVLRRRMRCQAVQRQPQAACVPARALLAALAAAPHLWPPLPPSNPPDLTSKTCHSLVQAQLSQLPGRLVCAVHFHNQRDRAHLLEVLHILAADGHAAQL